MKMISSSGCLCGGCGDWPAGSVDTWNSSSSRVAVGSRKTCLALVIPLPDGLAWISSQDTAVELTTALADWVGADTKAPIAIPARRAGSTLRMRDLLGMGDAGW